VYSVPDAPSQALQLFVTRQKVRPRWASFHPVQFSGLFALVYIHCFVPVLFLLPLPGLLPVGLSFPVWRRMSLARLGYISRQPVYAFDT